MFKRKTDWADRHEPRLMNLLLTDDATAKRWRNSSCSIRNRSIASHRWLVCYQHARNRWWHSSLVEPCRHVTHFFILIREFCFVNSLIGGRVVVLFGFFFFISLICVQVVLLFRWGFVVVRMTLWVGVSVGVCGGLIRNICGGCQRFIFTRSTIKRPSTVDKHTPTLCIHLYRDKETRRGPHTC